MPTSQRWSIHILRILIYNYTKIVHGKNSTFIFGFWLAFWEISPVWPLINQYFVYNLSMFTYLFECCLKKTTQRQCSFSYFRHSKMMRIKTCQERKLILWFFTSMVLVPVLLYSAWSNVISEAGLFILYVCVCVCKHRLKHNKWHTI